MRFRVVADGVAASINFSNKVRALTNEASDQKESCKGVVLLEDVEQLGRDGRIGPVIEGDSQPAR